MEGKIAMAPQGRHRGFRNSPQARLDRRFIGHESRNKPADSVANLISTDGGDGKVRVSFNDRGEFGERDAHSPSCARNSWIDVSDSQGNSRPQLHKKIRYGTEAAEALFVRRRNRHQRGVEF